MNYFLLLFVFITFNSQAQTTIFGMVINGETKQPLEAASVFASNTTYKTITDANGYFTIQVPAGTYELVTSFVGFATQVVKSENLQGGNVRYIIPLYPEMQNLKNVTIIAKSQRAKYLDIFRENLIGKSKNAARTKILNIDDVDLTIADDGSLEVTSEKPLVIENPELNYKLTFVLSYLKYDFKTATSHYSGFQSFEDLIPITKKNEKEIAQNRKRAYDGSIMHFMRSLYNNDYLYQGFHVLSMSVKPNPLYPGEEGVAKLKEEARKNKSYNHWQAIPEKNIFTYSKGYLNQNEIIRTESGHKLLNFPDYLKMYYSGEKEERNYLSSNHTPVPRYQDSQIRLEGLKVEIFPNGNFSNPQDVIFYGYMGWEKLADMLPYDYEPEPTSGK